LRSLLFLTELLLAAHDDALADVITIVMNPGAGAPADHSISPATARPRNRKKPPRWLQEPH
jgi:hypothetical protein